jgi:hypothetical protein
MPFERRYPGFRFVEKPVDLSLDTLARHGAAIMSLAREGVKPRLKGSVTSVDLELTAILR